MYCHQEEKVCWICYIYEFMYPLFCLPVTLVFRKIILKFNIMQLLLGVAK